MYGTQSSILESNTKLHTCSQLSWKWFTNEVLLVLYRLVDDFLLCKRPLFVSYLLQYWNKLISDSQPSKMKLIHEKVSVYISCPGWRCIPIIRAWNVLACNSVPPQLTTIEDIRGGFEPRTRTDEVGAESRELERPPSYSPATTLVAPGVLVHLQAAASVTLLFNAPLRSQNRFPGFPAFQTHLIDAKGWSCTCNMADSEWLDELSWYKRPVPLECFELRSCTQFWILILVAGGVLVQTNVVRQASYLSLGPGGNGLAKCKSQQCIAIYLEEKMK